MIKHKYIRLENIDKYDGWEVVATFPARDNSHYTKAVIRYDDASDKANLELINRQKAEIEMLETAQFQFISDINAYKEKLKTAKAEAIKEFAEKLKKYEGRRGVPIATIDNLVKEMVGDV